ncbi:unnamed protein product [Phytomonas sp. EM1]|nr:unnamed protein product [Phytomonas sp. EM1]|eukprot:CCW64128.1 unnamed protein product [Phytomonas sp. isolate EM1]
MHQGTLCRSFSRSSNRNGLLPIRGVARAASHNLSGRVLACEWSTFRFDFRSFCRFRMNCLNVPNGFTIPLLTSHRCTASFSDNQPHGGGKSGRDAGFTTDQLGGSEPGMADVPDSSLGMDYEFDPMASMQHDVAVDTAKKSFDRVLYELLPPNPPSSAVDKVRHYLQQHPIDILITQPRVQITHLEKSETGQEEKVSLRPVPLSEALAEAQQRSMNLVQMSTRDDLAFCRIRTERNRIMKLIEPDMQESASAMTAGGEHDRARKTKKLIEHSFRDAVDAHFIGWKSRKICEDMRKGHPVRISIKEFQSVESAMRKLREMCEAIRTHAEGNSIYHHVTSIVGNEREASVSLSPAVPSKTVKHPAEKEWAHAQKRMEDACRKAGRLGTYFKDGRLKPRNIGASLYRVDKYGRRVD